MSDESRRRGIVLDLEQLEEQAKSLYLHRFVDAVRTARGEFGRYLTVRAGDELAIRAADDGSGELFDHLSIEASFD
jgi:hypothetical protein